MSFTGNLERAILTNPFFFGKEKHFLRAQIARITHSTTLAPAGIFKLVEDSEREIEDNTPEEGPIKMPTTEAMINLNNWVHHTPSILLCNRL